jgi:hypothetical protein
LKLLKKLGESESWSHHTASSVETTPAGDWADWVYIEVSERTVFAKKEWQESWSVWNRKIS